MENCKKETQNSLKIKLSFLVNLKINLFQLCSSFNETVARACGSLGVNRFEFKERMSVEGVEAYIRSSLIVIKSFHLASECQT